MSKFVFNIPALCEQYKNKCLVITVGKKDGVRPPSGTICEQETNPCALSVMQSTSVTGALGSEISHHMINVQCVYNNVQQDGLYEPAEMVVN